MSRSSSTLPVASEPAIQAGPACTRVFVVDKHNEPLMPCSPKRAKRMLDSKRANVFCMNPFTIRILDREGGALQPVEIKLDPGSKTTGIAMIVQGAVRGWFCIGAWELSHRGQAIRKALLSRSQLRRGRRSRKTRYRQARFSNRTKPRGWLPPSLKSRVDNVFFWSRKIARVSPASSIAVESARFDMQLMENPDISGIQYQQGTLVGYEVREYLLEKWNRTCAYCCVQNVPLQIEHIIAKSNCGTNRISNLALACEPCNRKKGSHSIEVFLKRKPELLKSILRQAKASLKDAAAVNSTWNALVRELEALGIPVSTSTGGRTKFNRSSQNYAKTHWLDAVCVGETGSEVDVSLVKQVTLIKAKGRGSRQMCRPDKYGIPRNAAKSVKRIHGFQTGDRVKLVQPGGKYQGTHEGVISIRATGKFDIKTLEKLTISADHSRFSLISRFDGYTYQRKQAG